MKFVEIDNPAKQVFGWASVSLDSKGELVVDSYDHIIKPESLEKAAYESLGKLIVGKEHQAFDGIGYIIESFYWDVHKAKRMGLTLTNTAPHAAWWLGIQITNDELWDDIVSGKVGGLSIGFNAKEKNYP